MRPAYIWTPRDTQTRLDAMRELLAKASEETAHGGDMGRYGVSAVAQKALVAAHAAAGAARRYARALVGDWRWDDD